jgi:protein-S-isoprenylcysteine O-methyltransferase Ste14
MFFQTQFEIGILNAWIFTVFYFLFSFLPIIFRKKKVKKTRKISSFSVTDNVEDAAGKVIYWLSFVVFILTMIVSIFLPIIFGISFYIGLIIYILGITFIGLTITSWMNTPEGKVIKTGIYRYSRNPMYVSMFLTHIGISIVTLSWVFFLLTVVYSVLTIMIVFFEENACIQRFGESYKNYMKETPRWLGNIKQK